MGGEQGNARSEGNMSTRLQQKMRCSRKIRRAYEPPGQNIQQAADLAGSSNIWQASTIYSGREIRGSYKSEKVNQLAELKEREEV